MGLGNTGVSESVKDAIDYVSGKVIESVLENEHYPNEFSYVNLSDPGFTSIKITKDPETGKYSVSLVTESMKLEGKVDLGYISTSIYDLVKDVAPVTVVDVFEETFGIFK